jgi:hypothetical protein
MKSYTDLEQSKKLAEILPLESADMYYYTVDGDVLYKTPNVIESKDDLFVDEKSIPCWSLAALLSILPQPYTERYDENTWICSTFNKNNHLIDNASKNDPIDACYELIMKLHEQNLI